MKIYKWSRIFVPKELFKRISGLSPVAIELYGHLIESCDWKYGLCVASSAEIASDLGVTPRSIQRANKELESIGLIKVKRGVYSMNPEFAWSGRSWNISKAEYYRVTKITSANLTSLADVASIDDEKLEEIGRKTLREVYGRKMKRSKTC